MVMSEIRWQSFFWSLLGRGIDKKRLIELLGAACAVAWCCLIELLVAVSLVEFQEAQCQLKLPTASPASFALDRPLERAQSRHFMQGLFPFYHFIAS